VALPGLKHIYEGKIHRLGLLPWQSYLLLHLDANKCPSQQGHICGVSTGIGHGCGASAGEDHGCDVYAGEGHGCGASVGEGHDAVRMRGRFMDAVRMRVHAGLIACWVGHTLSCRSGCMHAELRWVHAGLRWVHAQPCRRMPGWVYSGLGCISWAWRGHIGLTGAGPGCIGLTGWGMSG
jgi:hypothetical protein